MLFDQFTQLEKQIQEGNSRVIGNQRNHTELVSFPDLSTFNYLTFALHASFVEFSWSQTGPGKCNNE